MMVRLIALALAMGAAAPVHAQAVNDYPTNARAEYVFACMATNGQTRDMLDRWTPSHTNTDIPRAATTRPANRISTRQIEDGSYLRLKNLQLGYNLPASVLKTARIQAMRLYVSAQNLVTWTSYSGYDPETNAGGQSTGTRGYQFGEVPIPRSFVLRINASF